MQSEPTYTKENISEFFKEISKHIVGDELHYQNSFGTHKMIYADWIASGRLYEPIEHLMTDLFGPLVGKTHSESSYSGEAMTLAYKMAHKIIKQHVNAGENFENHQSSARRLQQCKSPQSK